MFLRRELYESVAADPSELRPSIAVLLVSAVVQYSLMESPFPRELSLWALVLGMLFAVVRWLVYAAIFYPFARLFTRQKRPFPRLLRCLGFAEAPGVARVSLFFLDPSAAPWVNLAVAVWLLASSVVAARAALSTTLLRAVLVTGASFGIYQLFGIATGALAAPLR
jgi:hypothetical protein